MLLCRVALGDVHIAKYYDSALYKGDPLNPARRPPTKNISNSNLTHDRMEHCKLDANFDNRLYQLYDSVLGESKSHGGDTLNYREFIVYDRYGL
jgi:hypothetical protein